MKDQKSQSSKNDKHKKGDIYPCVSSVREEALTEERETGITKSWNRMKDRMRKGLSPGKLFLPAEEKRKRPRSLEEKRIQEYAFD